MTIRTSTLFAGQKDRLERVGEVVQVDDADAVQLGHLVEVVVVGDDLALQVLGQQHQLLVDRLAGEFGQLAVVDHEVDLRVAAEPVEDVEPAAAAVAAELVGGIGDGLQLGDDELRHDQLVVDDAGLDDVGDPPVDDDAGVEHVGLEAL